MENTTAISHYKAKETSPFDCFGAELSDEANADGGVHCVEQEVFDSNVTEIHGQKWSSDIEEFEVSDVLVECLKEWLGAKSVGQMTKVDLAAMANGLGMMTKPAPEESGAWEAIQNPDNIERVKEAVRRFQALDGEAVRISERMGKNNRIRKHLKEIELADETTLDVILAHQSALNQRINVFISGLEDMKGAMEKAFDGDEYSVGAALIVIAGRNAILESLDQLSDEVSIPEGPDEEELEILDRLRRNVVASAESVRRVTGIFPITFSNNALSGVKRALSKKSAADFTFSVEALGGKIETREKANIAGRVFNDFFAAQRDFNEATFDYGISSVDEKQIVSHILIRRQMKAAARVLEVDWESVSSMLKLKQGMTREGLKQILSDNEFKGDPARLRKIATHHSETLSSVRDRSQEDYVKRSYWLIAAERVCAEHGDVTISRLKEIIKSEEAIDVVRETLRSFGAETLEDVHELDTHLKWASAASALPVPDAAVEKLFSEKGRFLKALYDPPR